MKAPRSKAPRKEPIPILKEWTGYLENVELNPHLNQLSKLLTQPDLSWDQQVVILRKLETELSKKDKWDQQLRDQLENILQPVVCQAYFVSIEGLSRRYLMPLIKLCDENSTVDNTGFLATYQAFLDTGVIYEQLPVSHKALTITSSLEYDIGVQAIEKNFNATLRFLLSPIKKLYGHHQQDMDVNQEDTIMDDGQWPYGRSTDAVLSDVQYVLKSILAVLTKAGSDENAELAAAFQQDNDLVHDLLQSVLNIFASGDKYNIDCLQVAGMVIVAAVNSLGDSSLVLDLLTAWFLEGNQQPSEVATEYARKFNLEFPASLRSTDGWNSPESPMLMIIRGMVSNTSLQASLMPIHISEQVDTKQCWNEEVYSDQTSPLNLLQICFQALSVFCANSKLEPQCKVIAFDGVTSWLQRIKNLLKKDSSNSAGQTGEAITLVMTEKVREMLVMYVWSHWDDPVDAVQHKVKSMFELLLEVLQLHAQVESDEEQYQLFIQSLLAQLLAMDWHRKVKYALLSLLLPSLLTENFLQHQPDFIWRSLQAMDNMVIQPRVAALLGQFLEKRLVETVPQYRKNKTQKGGKVDGPENKEVRDWMDLWLSPALCALSTSSDVLRRNVGHLVLTPLLEFYSSGLWRIMAILQDNTMFEEHVGKEYSQYKLNAFISVIRVARKLDIIDAANYTEDYRTGSNAIALPLLRSAMDHADIQVRADVLGLICESKKSGSYITQTECKLLEEFLPLNLNSTSPEFRQTLYSEITKFFTKLRGNLFAQYRKQLSVQKYAEDEGTPMDKRQIASQELETLKSYIEFSKGFLQRLIELCFASLYPGSSFQRSFSALRVITSLIKVFGITEVPTPEGFLGKPVFPFPISIATEQNTKALIGVLMDPYDQNRMLSFNILMEFPSPLPGYEDKADVQRLLWWGLEKVRSKRAGESDSGAMVLRLLFRTYIMAADMDLEVEEEQSGLSQNESMDQHLPSSLRFAWKLTHLIERQLDVAKENILLSAEEYPMHGTLLALRYLFQELEYEEIGQGDNSSAWKDIHEKIISLSCDISDVVLGVLSNPSPEGNMPASFQEIGETIDDILDDNQDGENDTNSPKHQVILSSCWRAIKEASTLLEAIITRVPTTANGAGEPLISNDYLLKCGNLLRTLLMCIRHRGAFSAVYPAYVSLCSRLLKSTDSNLSKVPLSWLEENIESITASSISVTRRSAGLPLCIMAIISSETSSRKSMLQLTMRKLIEIASVIVSEDANQTVDTPQVHAYNIMRQIFMDSKLGQEAIIFAEDGFHLAIGGFSSPSPIKLIYQYQSWAIRNCSVMLFSTLLQRTLGVKKTKDEHSVINLLTATEFFTRYPQLKPYLIEQLTEAVRQLVESGETSRVHPGLYPILTLLSRLQPSTVDSDAQRESLSAITPLATSCSRSSIYKTREMAARALVPLISSDSIVTTVIETLESCNPANQNELHGKLLQCQYLLRGHLHKRDSIELWTSFVREVPETLMAKLRDLIVLNECPITVALLLDIILEFFIVCDIFKTDSKDGIEEFNSVCAENLSELRTYVASYCKHQLLDTPSSHALDPSLVGLYLLRQKQAEILATLFLKDFNQELSNYTDLLVKLLSVDIYEVRLSVIEIIKKLLNGSVNKRVDRNGLCRKLSSMIYEEESHLDCFRNAVLLLTQIDSTNPYLDDGSLPFTITDLWFRLVHQMDSSKNQSTQEAILPLMGALLAQILQTQHRSSSQLQFVKNWSTTFAKYSNSNVTLPLREATVMSLSFIAPYIFNNVEEIKSEDLTNEIIATHMSIIELLQDDDGDIRHDVAIIVSKAIGLQMNVNCEKALELVYHHLEQYYVDSQALEKALKSSLTTSYSMESILDANSDASKVLFEQENPNIYRESLVDAQWATISLSKLKVGVTQEVVEQDTVQYLSRVEVIIKAVQDKDASSFGPFGITLRPATFEEVYDTIMLANVQLQLLARVGVPARLIASLNDLLDFLSKQSPQSLHPILATSIYGENGLLGQICRLTDKSYRSAGQTNSHIHTSGNQFFLTKNVYEL